MDPPTSPDAALGVHWVGHATMLVQLGELVVLTDPVFTETVGGLSRRLVAASLTSESLPPIDVALVSHRHFDHLSIDSLEAIAPKLRALVVPKGAEHDVPALPVPIHALGWNAGHTFGALEVTAVPVAHTSDRLLFDADSHPEAYAGYVLRHRGVTVFFAGDTAFDERVFRAVRERFGPIDLALLPIGPIAPREVMAPTHLDPPEALRAMALLEAKQLVALHFGTFINSDDGEGDCERAFDAAVADAHLEGRALRLAIGERRTLRSSNPAADAEQAAP